MFVSMSKLEILGFTLKMNSIVLKPYNPESQYIMRNPSNYQKNPTNKKYTGMLSPSTAAKIKKNLYCWLTSIFITKKENYSLFQRLMIYPTFVTLTLSEPQKHTDQEIKKIMLKPFLQAVKRKINYKFMYWRAEKQKNGNIHFHIIFDKYIHYKEVQKIWNNTQSKNKYLVKYFKEHGLYHAPSTHIEKVNTLQESIMYLIKYTSKNQEGMEVAGRQYSVSKGIEKLSYYTNDLDDILVDDLYKYLSKNKNQKYKNEWITAFYMDEYINPYNMPESFRPLIVSYYLDLFDRLYVFKSKHTENLIKQNYIPEYELMNKRRYVQSKLNLHTQETYVH